MGLPGRKICRPRGGASASGESTASCVHHALQHKVVLRHKIVPLQRRSMMCSDCGISWEGCTQLRLTSCCVLHTMRLCAHIAAHVAHHAALHAHCRTTVLHGAQG